jgi:hypothetical protein
VDGKIICSVDEAERRLFASNASRALGRTTVIGKETFWASGAVRKELSNRPTTPRLLLLTACFAGCGNPKRRPQSEGMSRSLLYWQILCPFLFVVSRIVKETRMVVFVPLQLRSSVGMFLLPKCV